MLHTLLSINICMYKPMPVTLFVDAEHTQLPDAKLLLEPLNHTGVAMIFMNRVSIRHSKMQACTLLA